MVENGIYKIINIINGKIYIGSAFCVGGIKRRWVVHKSSLNRHRHHNKYLQSAWIKYGSENFIFEVVEIINRVEDVLSREQYYIDFYESYNDKIGYNICKNASAPMLGIKHSEESKKKIGDSSKGNKYSLGFKHSEETKKLMSEAKLNESLETRVKRSKSLIGNKNSLGVIPVNIKSVKQLDKDNNLIKIWRTITEAQNNLNICASNIVNVCQGKRKTCGGFKWEYN